MFSGFWQLVIDNQALVLTSIVLSPEPRAGQPDCDDHQPGGEGAAQGAPVLAGPGEIAELHSFAAQHHAGGGREETGERNPSHVRVGGRE